MLVATTGVRVGVGMLLFELGDTLVLISMSILIDDDSVGDTKFVVPADD